jgi:hypothetical protein
MLIFLFLQQSYFAMYRVNVNGFSSVYSDYGVLGFDAGLSVNLGPEPLTLMKDATFSS